MKKGSIDRAFCHGHSVSMESRSLKGNGRFSLLAVDKDDWVFLPVINGITNTQYDITLRYNAFDNPNTASESFEVVILDTPSSTATSQNIIATYTMLIFF